MFDFVKYFPSEVRKTNVRFRWQCGCQQVKWPRGPRVCILFHVAMLYYIPFMSRKYIPNDFRTKCFDIIHASLEIQGFSGSHPQHTILCWHVHAISIIMQSWKFSSSNSLSTDSCRLLLYYTTLSLRCKSVVSPLVTGPSLRQSRISR